MTVKEKLSHTGLCFDDQDFQFYIPGFVSVDMPAGYKDKALSIMAADMPPEEIEKELQKLEDHAAEDPDIIDLLEAAEKGLTGWRAETE